MSEIAKSIKSKAPQQKEKFWDVIMCAFLALSLGLLSWGFWNVKPRNLTIWLLAVGVSIATAIMLGAAIRLTCMMIVKDKNSLSNFIDDIEKNVLKDVSERYKVEYLKRIETEFQDRNILAILKNWLPLILTCVVALQSAFIAMDGIRGNVALSVLKKTNNISESAKLISDIFGDYASLIALFSMILLVLAVVAVYENYFSKNKTVRTALNEVIYRCYREKTSNEKN